MSCDCSSMASRMTVQLPEQLEFKEILDLGRGIEEQWLSSLHCTQCRTDTSASFKLVLVADRLLSLYEAAFASYIVTDRVVPGDPRRSSCLKSRMTLGSMDITGHDEMLLAVLLLTPRFSTLRRLLLGLTGKPNLEQGPSGAYHDPSYIAHQPFVVSLIERIEVILGRMKLAE